MTKKEFVFEVEKMLELSPGTLREESDLSSFENWDSLAHLAFIAFASEKFEVVVDVKALRQVRTINDLACLLENKPLN